MVRVVGHRLYSFETEPEALEATRELIALNPGSYPGALALTAVDWSYPARADGLWLGQDSSGWYLRSYSAGLR